MEQKLLKSDHTKKLFTIQIEVFENSSNLMVSGENNHEATYQEVVGALEITKQNFCYRQSEYNRKSLKAKKSK